jgi:tripartite-type tricarboxylate transporter receptor subunit TctC
MKNPERAVVAIRVGICGRLLLALLPVLPLTVGQAMAEADYPTRVVRLVHGFGPGTPPDIAARVLGEKFSQVLGRPVIIENAIGASGNLAAERVARSDPDGHTLLLASNSTVVMNPSLYEKMPFDPVKDLAPISLVYSYPNILVVHKDVAASGVQELVALARARPGELTFASPGAGTSVHLAGEMLKSMAKIDIRHVPYRGGTNLVADLIAGRVDMYFGPSTSTLEQARAGTVRALAVTSSRRYAGAPDLPTIAESGFPEFDVPVWWGLMAPAGTPPAIVEKLHHETVRLLALPETRKRFDDIGVEPVGSSPAEFAAVIAADLPKWAKVIRGAGIRLD